MLDMGRGQTMLGPCACVWSELCETIERARIVRYMYILCTAYIGVRAQRKRNAINGGQAVADMLIR